jgi:hypothetical protein
MLGALVIGCGGSSSPDGTMKEMIALMNEEASLWESKADKSKLDELKSRGEALKKRWDSFSKEQQEAAKAKYKDEVVQAAARMMKAKMGDLFKGLPNPKDFKLPKP